MTSLPNVNYSLYENAKSTKHEDQESLKLESDYFYSK